MSRRIEIELTSPQEGHWTWRAAGAREPKGTIESALVPQGAGVGDVLRVEAEFHLDGIEITSVIPPKGARPEPERLELLGAPLRDDALVTTTVRGRDGRRGGPRRRRDEGDRDRQRPRRREGDDRERRRPRSEGERPRRQRPAPPPPPPVPERPKPKRLRAGRTHRNELLGSLPEEQRPVAEQVVLGGLPAVRQAIEKQNTERAAAGEPAINAAPLLELAERLVPRVRAAEWLDKAESALRDVDQLDLRDLRSVVSAADAAARSGPARELATQLRDALTRRVDEEQAAWLAELTATLDVGRVVRALRLSSRPPKAGSLLPADLLARLADAAAQALGADAGPDRWVAVLDALAYSPVRDRVIPSSLPTELHADVRATIARLAPRLPKVAHIFEIEPDPTAPRPRPERRRQQSKRSPAKAKADKPGADKPAAEDPSPGPGGDAEVSAPEA